MKEKEYNLNKLDNRFFCATQNFEYNTSFKRIDRFDTQQEKNRIIKHNNYINVFKFIYIVFAFVLFITPVLHQEKETTTDTIEETINEGNNETIIKNSKFNKINITYDNFLVSFQMDFIDENNYWSNFLIVFNMADGTSIKKDIISGQEKEKYYTNYKKTDLISIYIFCDNIGNNDLEYNETYSKSIIYKYIFE